MKTDRADVVHGTRRVVVVVLVSFASVVAANGVVPRRVQASLDVVIVVDVIVVARGAAVRGDAARVSVCVCVCVCV